MGSDIDDARLATDGGIPYKLMEGYPRISASDDGCSAEEQYLIRSRDVAAFFAESMPPPIVFLDFITQPARRRMPGTGFLVTKEVSFEPFDKTKPGDPFRVDPSAASGTYSDLYVANIKYETGQESDETEHDENKPETFLEHDVNVGGEFLSIPPAKTKIVEDDLGTPQSYGAAVDNPDRNSPVQKIVATMEHNLRWKFVLVPPWEEILRQLGHVNRARHAVFFDSPAECVLFMGVSGKRQYLWNGASVVVQPWSLDYKFSAKEITEGANTWGWNHVYSPDKGKFVRLFRAGGLPLYESADFTLLFKKG
jgi:hypothetical protein